ncbi:MAG: hypothetical protein AAFQ98_14450, partial [Bacteroidota bacterium]
MKHYVSSLLIDGFPGFWNEREDIPISVFDLGNEEGLSEGSLIGIDAPATYQTGGDPPTWTPKNSDLKYTGQTLTIRQGMARSINSVTAHIMDKVQPMAVVDVCRRMGITSSLAPVLSLCLGVSDVSVYEMVGAYSTYANQGTFTKPFFITKIEDRIGLR